jgi:hypothetical protein
MISLLQLEMAASACMDTSLPFQDEEDAASQELSAARAANSLADDNSTPPHEVGADKRTKVSDAPPPPQLVMRPVSQLERLVASISVNAAEPSWDDELETSADSFWNWLKRLLSDCKC